MIPCSYWALTWIAALPSCITLYEISVRQTRDLPVVSLFPHPASFGFRLTMDTLAFGYILPTTGRIRDFNPLETCAAGRTILIRTIRSTHDLLDRTAEWFLFFISLINTNYFSILVQCDLFQKKERCVDLNRLLTCSIISPSFSGQSVISKIKFPAWRFFFFTALYRTFFTCANSLQFRFSGNSVTE